MKNVIVSLGPIPAKLDSVKYITNRFKGRLGLKIAEYLSSYYNVTIMKWKYNDIITNIPTINVDDVYGYRDAILKTTADAYILSAAVANLVPVKPWDKKFPSHLYGEDDQFSIDFKLAPRVIELIKKQNPYCCLIGYKLFDGSHEELINAARKVLINSKANVVFANTPEEAKWQKTMVTQDFAEIPMNFEEHMDTIKTLINQVFYHTSLIGGNITASKKLSELYSKYPKTLIGGRTFGTFAFKDAPSSFYTTSRGKSVDGMVKVDYISHDKRIIYASDKPTMNAPLLGKILQNLPIGSVVLHDHIMLDKPIPTFPYRYPGTVEETLLTKLTETKFPVFNIKHHGFIATFETIDKALVWIKSLKK